MSSQMSSLAVEVIEFISAFLEPADLRSLRLVCRGINRKTLRYFALANFATVQTDFSRKSLQRLQSISESEHLAVHVQCLQIMHRMDGKLGQGLDWRPHQGNLLVDQLDGPGVPRNGLVKRLLKCRLFHINSYDEYNLRREKGSLLLRDILVKRLLKCRSFHINSYDEYDFRRETGTLLPSDAVGIVLSVVAEANLAIRSFTVKSSPDGNGRLDTQRLRMPLCHTPQFIAAWAHVKELILDYKMSFDQYDWILFLISSAPQLRKLLLVFYDTDSLFMERLSSLHVLDKVENLSLRFAHVLVDSISRLLLNNRETVHSLSLQYATIENGGKWATVLRSMKGQLPRLENLSLFGLKEQTGDGHVFFSKLASRPVVPTSKVYAPGYRLISDSHLLEQVEEPVRLIYWGGRRRVVGIEYHGTAINDVLSALADTAETIRYSM